MKIFQIGHKVNKFLHEINKQKLKIENVENNNIFNFSNYNIRKF
ncbi:hypothetical protein NPIRD3C_1149 [Nitrosopumilus piranensis]|uniref:Uncharacterized protein n=1 Tax=Nitrosopumilus piranensis TaxID=1582439 RepID=A0A0C5BVS1_9ARCH|nr:hypothetical protein NPIRD3C_1149 [Nitrosopumilus piranensis]